MSDHSIICQETDQALRVTIAAQLVAAGLVRLERTTAIAMKTYPTAVGLKDAHVYLADFGPEETNYVLQGEYYSEGRNALGGSGVLIPKDADPELAIALTVRFAVGAEKSVLSSYAARLYQRWGASASDCDQAEGEKESEGEAPPMSM